MRTRYVYLGIGIMLLAAALALPVLAQPRGPAGFGWGPGGMHGGGMMGGGGMGPGADPAARPVTTIDDAASRAREVLAGYGSGLTVAEVMEFRNHYYVLVKEQNTGRGAFELLVQRNGFVHPEPGPNMMWNTKYGRMAGAGYGMMGGGMMGGGWGYGRGPAGQAATPQAQSVAPERAQQLAAQYLAQIFPGSTVEHGTAFYGYFTFDFVRGGTIAGMVSVNASTGQVWYHSWHGAFVAEKEF